MAKRSEALSDALSKCISKQPFFAVLLMDLMKIVETDGTDPGLPIPTAGTDGRHLYVNTTWFENLSIDERLFVLCHEVLHVVLEHPARNKLYMDRGIGPDLKQYNPTKMNVACDYIINDWIVKSGQTAMPHGGMLNPQYDMREIADELYCKLPDPPQQQKDGGSGDGTGNWDKHMAPSDDAVSQQPSKADIQRALKSAVASAKAQGLLPGDYGRMVDEICEPQVNWAEQLRLNVVTAAGRDDTTWARPNRKRLAISPSVYMPGTCAHKAGVICLASDSSGSVSDSEMSHYFGEMASIMDEMKPEEGWISDCSHHCAEFLPIESADDVVAYKPRTSGGTHMPDIFRQLVEQDINPDVLVILTDGYTDYGTEPPYEVIWVMTSDKVAPYGKSLHIKIGG